MLTALDGGQDLDPDTLCPLAEGILQRVPSRGHPLATYTKNSHMLTALHGGQDLNPDTFRSFVAGACQAMDSADRSPPLDDVHHNVTKFAM